MGDPIIMSNKENYTVRELSAIELDQVSGSLCPCCTKTVNANSAPQHWVLADQCGGFPISYWL
jgi:hypothetical protein